MDRRRIAVAVSGGVDSLCALLLCKEAGHDVIAIHGQLFSGQNSAYRQNPAYQALAAICSQLGVRLELLDLTRIFAKRIINPFVGAWISGLTPNPCSICNRIIKFGALLAAARYHGASVLATGHYAALVPNPYGEGKILASARDLHKDQSYFLGLVSQKQLNQALFPLADTDKESCRRIVANAGLQVPVAKESQDICFLNSCAGDYRKFLAQNINLQVARQQACGPILIRLTAEQNYGQMQCLGRHTGLWNYTPGQRRGLGLPWSEPLHVLEKVPAGNILVVGPKKLCSMRALRLHSLCLHVNADLWPQKLFVRTRHNGTLLPASARYGGSGLHVELHEPNWPTARGQVTVIYDEFGHVLAAGVVDKIFH